MKIATFLGTRPEIIRLSRVIPLLDRNCRHVLVHTGQNHEECLSDVFFRELAVRQPDYALGCRSDTFAAQISRILEGGYRVLQEATPDRVLILGDTNSGLVSIVAKRMGIPVYHMEAGNRCRDDRVPEEVNRRIIDAASSVWLPYTSQAKENLIAEGVPRQRIFVTGNPIAEVLASNRGSIEERDALAPFGIEPHGYFLVTLHRAENVDVPERLKAFCAALEALADEYRLPVIFSVHPRTRSRMAELGLANEHPRLHLVQPLGFYDFVRLEQAARCVLTDSGTVQEECCILGVPTVTLRDTTERPETIECGSNILSGADPEAIRRCVELVGGRRATWPVPEEYRARNVAETVVRILLGYCA